MMEKVLLASLLMGLCAAVFAKKNNLNHYFWFCAGVLFGFLALIVLFILLNYKTPAKQQPPAKPVMPILKIPDSKLWYYLTEEKRETGPMSLTKLLSLYKNNKIFENTFVWNEELDHWIKLKNSDIFDLYFVK